MRVQSIGRFQVLAELARGGAGVVYRAYDPQQGREVALKLLLNSRAQDATTRKRFEREAHALAQLEHPNLVRVFESGEHGGRPYLAMELIDGEPLERRLERGGPLLPAMAAEAALALAEALEHAHERGFLHRDVKPSNVLLDRAGEPRLTDFGLVHEVAADVSRLSRTGVFLGTPGYCAPEQAEGDKSQTGPATDVFGLGATLYAMLTALPPFQPTLQASLSASWPPPTPPSSLQPQVDRGLDEICLRCLARSPDDRYPTVAALADDLRRYLAGEAPASPPRRGWAGLWVSVALLSAVGIGWLLVTRPPPAQPPSPARSTPPPQQPTPADPAGSPHPEAAELLERFQAQAETGEWPGLEEICSQALALDPQLAPEFAKAWRRLGLAEDYRDDLPAAALAFGHSLALEPDHVTTLRSRAVVLMDLGEREAALEDVSHAIELDPAAAHSWLARADMLSASGDHPRADADYTRAIELDASLAAAWSGRGISRGLQGREEEAVKDFDRAVDLEPEEATHWHNRAVSKSGVGDRDGALADLQQAARLDSNQPRIWKDLAVAHRDRGEHREASSAATRALMLEPEYPQALNIRAAARRKLGDLDGALKDLEQTVRLAPPNSPEVRWARTLIGMVKEEQGRRR